MSLQRQNQLTERLTEGKSDPVCPQAVQEQLGSGHLPGAQLVLQPLNLYALQTAVFIATDLCIEQRQTAAALCDRDRHTSADSITLITDV